MWPHCPHLAPPNKSAELHHLTSRKKWMCRWEKWWKIPHYGNNVEIFSFPFLLEALINSEIFTYSNRCSDLSNRFLPQQKNEAIPLWLIYFISSSVSMLIPIPSITCPHPFPLWKSYICLLYLRSISVLQISSCVSFFLKTPHISDIIRHCLSLLGFPHFVSNL